MDQAALTPFRVVILTIVAVSPQSCIHSVRQSEFFQASKVDTQRHGTPIVIEGDPDVTVFMKFNHWGAGCEIHSGQGRTWFIELSSPAPDRTYEIHNSEAKAWFWDRRGDASGDQIQGTVRVLNVSPERIDLEVQLNAEIRRDGQPAGTAEFKGVQRFEKPRKRK